MANWTPSTAFVPTQLSNFTLIVSKDRAETPDRIYVAKIVDQNGKQKFVQSGNIEGYLSEADCDALEAIIETLFEKAENEMI